MTKAERAEGIAPDIPSDVSEWGDRKVLGKDLKDMSAQELAEAEKEAEKLPPLPHTQDRP